MNNVKENKVLIEKLASVAVSNVKVIALSPEDAKHFQFKPIEKEKSQDLMAGSTGLNASSKSQANISVTPVITPENSQVYGFENMPDMRNVSEATDKQSNESNQSFNVAQFKVPEAKKEEKEIIVPTQFAEEESTLGSFNEKEAQDLANDTNAVKVNKMSNSDETASEKIDELIKESNLSDEEGKSIFKPKEVPTEEVNLSNMDEKTEKYDLNSIQGNQDTTQDTFGFGKSEKESMMSEGQEKSTDIDYGKITDSNVVAQDVVIPQDVVEESSAEVTKIPEKVKVESPVATMPKDELMAGIRERIEATEAREEKLKEENLELSKQNKELFTQAKMLKEHIEKGMSGTMSEEEAKSKMQASYEKGYNDAMRKVMMSNNTSNDVPGGEVRSLGEQN